MHYLTFVRQFTDMIGEVDLAIPITASAVRPAELAKVAVPGLYVHIPFCFHKCHYCDFYSITRQTPQRMGHFVDRVLTEAEIWAAGNEPKIMPRTVFFGGGTPSLLPLEGMD